MKRPMLGLSVAFASGIVLGWWTQVDFWAWVWMTLALVALAVCLLFLRNRFSHWILFAAVLAAGGMMYHFSSDTPSPRHIKNLLRKGESRHIELRGVVATDPRYRSFEPDMPLGRQRVSNAATDTTAEIIQRADFFLDVREAKLLDVWEPVEGRIYVTANLTSSVGELEYGQLIRCDGVIESPEPARNPGQFDFAAYLANQHVFFLLKLSSPRNQKLSLPVVVERDGAGNRFVAYAIEAREQFNVALRRGLFAGETPTPHEAQIAGLLSGMLLGYREAIPDDIKLAFTRTGAMHIFAISGLNVAMIATVLLIGLRLLRVPRQWCAVFVIPTLLFFVVAVGFQPSAVRAFIMASVFLSSWLFVRPTDALNTLGAAALGVLGWDSMQLFDPGFQMSFVVVGSIILWMPQFEKIIEPCFQSDPFVPRELLPVTSRAGLWCGRRFGQWLALSFAAGLGALPFTAYYFNLFSPISILENMFVVSLAFIIVVTGSLSIFFSAVFPWLTETMNAANYAFGSAMVSLTEWFAEVPGGFSYVSTPPVWSIAAYYIIVGALLAGWTLRRRWLQWTATSAAVAFVCVALIVWFWEQRFTRLTFLDVGAGSAIFLDTSGERHDALIDGGREEAGRFIVEPFLRSRGVDALEFAVMSQGDVVHAGGLHSILQSVPVTALIESGWRSSGARMQREVLDAARDKKIPLREMRAGDSVSLGNGVELRALHPPPETPFRTLDDNALVLQVRVGEHRVLLMSDAGESVEKLLLESDADLKSDIICFGQHRHERMGTPAFLERVAPKAVIISRGGAWGGRGAPAEFLEEISRRGIELFDIARDGAVTVELAPRERKIKTLLSRQ